MGQADRGDTGGAAWLVVGKPAQLGDGQGGHGDASNGVGPGAAAAGLVALPQILDELVGGCGAAGVVPQQGRTDDPPVGIEEDHAVLLAADGQGGDVIEPADGVDDLPQRPPPVVGMDLRAGRVGGPGLADEDAGGGVANDDLARLRRGVDAGDEGHTNSFHDDDGGRGRKAL